MEVFTIVANEVIGLSATECTLIQFSYNPEQIRDPESVLRSAVKDYLKTDEGKRQLEINCIRRLFYQNGHVFFQIRIPQRSYP